MLDLRGIVERDLKDAKIPELSADRRYATAYNAILQLTKMVIACSGYRDHKLPDSYLSLIRAGASVTRLTMTWRMSRLRMKLLR